MLCILACELTVRALIQAPLRSEQGPSVSVGLSVFGRLPWDPGRLSYPPGPIGSMFLWRVSVDRDLPVYVHNLLDRPGPDRE